VTNANSSTAYERIREAIVDGRFRPGQRLVEQRIAEELDLSRTPIREALRSLEAEGLVVIEVNRGAVVRPVEATDIDDLYELRARLESYAAFRAGRLCEPAQLAGMDQAIKGFDRAVARAAAGDREALREVNACNTEFHQAVTDAAHHPRLAILLRRATDVPLVFQAFRHFDRAALRRSNTFHRMIRDAIAVGDGPRAERLMTEHIDQGRDVLLAQLADGRTIDALFDC
jgi:DNA-binding GntR family transcriptional regulator